MNWRDRACWVVVWATLALIAGTMIVDGWDDLNECLRRHQHPEPGKYRCF